MLAALDKAEYPKQTMEDLARIKEELEKRKKPVGEKKAEGAKANKRAEKLSHRVKEEEEALKEKMG